MLAKIGVRPAFAYGVFTNVENIIYPEIIVEKQERTGNIALVLFYV